LEDSKVSIWTHEPPHAFSSPRPPEVASATIGPCGSIDHDLLFSFQRSTGLFGRRNPNEVFYSLDRLPSSAIYGNFRFETERAKSGCFARAALLSHRVSSRPDGWDRCPSSRRTRAGACQLPASPTFRRATRLLARVAILLHGSVTSEVG
jgi:hypothetical protein